MEHGNWQERINELFATTTPPDADAETMTVYLRHMRSRIEHPCYLIQAQEDSARFEALLLLDFDEEVDDEQGIMARVCRSSDGRVLDVSLAELECCDDSSPNNVLFEDFTRWFMHTLLRRMSGSEA
ncbi:MAG: hypothetical protein V5A14_03420 [Desulfohalobiaceae bacterium]